MVVVVAMAVAVAAVVVTNSRRLPETSEETDWIISNSKYEKSAQRDANTAC